MKKLLIFILIITLIIGAFIFIQKDKFTIEEANCEGFTACNKTIQLNEMWWKNETIKIKDLSTEFLDNECMKLKEDYWGCNKYLVHKL